MTAGLYDHLVAMTDRVATFEHALLSEPRREHGYCVDDVARVLVVVAREPHPDQELLRLARTSFRFLTEAQAVDGRVRNRRSVTGRWSGSFGVEDCWGRSVCAFGTAARRAPERWMRESALAYFERGASQRSPWPRAMAFAALGAIEVLVDQPSHRGARGLLAAAVDSIGRPTDDEAWPWPEARLSYANAVFAEVLIVAGRVLDRPELTDDGLQLLRWLLDRETIGTHLSPTPATGADRISSRPGFDQQPIEVAAMADACRRAAKATGEAAWLGGVMSAVRWFAGDNDAGAAMSDPSTGGGFDGLHAHGPNLNQGAESTLALITTRQHERALAAAGA